MNIGQAMLSGLCMLSVLGTVHYKTCLFKRTANFITKTCLYNFDLLKPHFYIVKFRILSADA